ncbi:MAG TPA: four helix bundle protein [Lacipirellulaceae bacterium]|nr:four helix bundle protein [Lacipirellulaceae bacterium]
MQDFRNLKVWEKAHALVLAVYRQTRSFPSDERFGLTSHLRRSCASIAANLAEGCARGGDLDFARFVSIAAGSASETDYHLVLARDLGYLPAATYETMFAQVSEVKRMLNAFERSLRGAASG